MKRVSLFAVPLAILLSSGTAFGADVQGPWLRDDGEMQVKFDKCGDSLCGNIVWIKPSADTKAKIGQRMFFDMKPDGASSWTGKAESPSDGTVYSGKISMMGDLLTTDGCVVGGLICKSARWSRVR